MTSKFAWHLLQQLSKVWVRVLAYAILAIATVIVAQFFGQYLPGSWSSRVGAESVGRVLGILASSMLAVTTFSLSVAVSAFATAARLATPRATALLQQDTTTQNVLSTFLGAFLFSLVGIVALQAGYYTDSGEVVLFASTVLVIGLVILAFLRWIAHLMTFGRMDDTLDRLEAATFEAMKLRLSRPCLGANAATGAPPDDAIPIRAGEVGYVQHIDLKSLSENAERLEARIWLTAAPGTLVHERGIVAYVERAKLDGKDGKKIKAAFSFDRTRTFGQDPRFGLVVLSEVASRALSPAVNDPGTAIAVINRLLRVLSAWRTEECKRVDYPRLFLPPISTTDLLEDAFGSIARDAGHLFEVHLHLQKALWALADTSRETFENSAQKLSSTALKHAEDAGLFEDKLERLAAASPSR